MTDNFDTGLDGKFQNLFDEKGRMEIFAGMRYYKKTEDENNMPRLVVRLKEVVDEACLKSALEETLPRFRVHAMKVVTDRERCYLMVNEAPPVLHKNDGTRQTVGGAFNNGYLTRVGYCGHEITIDIFHGSCDGMGTLPFMQSLLFAYCREKYGAKAEDIPGLILPDTPEDPREYADPILFLPSESVLPEGRYQWQQGFSLPDEQMASPFACAHYHIDVDAATMDGFLKKHETSVSTAFSLLANRVIARNNDTKGLPVVAAMAVNARPAYHAEKTMQCCVGTLPIYYDEEMDALSLDEQLKKTREIILTQARPENIIAAAQGTLRFNQKMMAEQKSLEEKRAYCTHINARSGSLYTYGISYVGKVQLGKGIDEHISEISAQLSANTLPLVIEIVKFDGRYQVTWMSHFKKDRYLEAFCDLLEAEGISAKWERRADFEETIALFEEDAGNL